MEEHIIKGAVKVVEIIGVSEKSFEDAVQEALKRAAKSIDAITGLEVVKFTGHVKNGKIAEYHANVKLAFIVK